MLALSLLFSAFAGCNSTESKPTDEPTDAPTDAPTEKPTEKPTSKPTEKPTEKVVELPKLPSGMELKIGSYNIKNGSEVAHDLSVIGNDIKEQGLDIVGIQEVDQFVNRSGNQDTMKILSESSGLEYYTFFRAIHHDGGEYGLGILSRYPIVSKARKLLDSKGNEQRIFCKAVIDIDGEKINFFVTHLSYEDMTLNAAQTATIIVELRETDGNFILTGDFNSSDFSAYERAGFGVANSGENRVQSFIDNIIYSKALYEFSAPSNLPNGHSDHNMIYATAKVK
jgi:endonuclease/exonuclease/phosphatase family metal-dependent hydrolase